MNTLPFNGYEARAMAHQMTSNREPYQIANPGILLRSVRSYIQSVFESIEQLFSWATREATYCNLNPAECRGIA